MSIFERIKNFLSGNNKQKLLNPGNNMEKKYTQQISNSGEYAMITDIDFERQIKHRDGRITNLMIAKIINGNPEDAIVLARNENIAFEIPEGSEITETVLKKIVDYYLYERNISDNSKECMYIGELNQDANDYEMQKSDAVNEYITNEVNERMKSQKQEKQRQNQERLQEEKQNSRQEFLARTAIRNNRYQQERNQRIQNSYLNTIDTYKCADGKQYQDLNGININNGDILKLRKLEKIAKDTNGTYIYTAYLQSTSNENSAEMLSKDENPLGNPICFLSDKKMEDIINEGNSNEIMTALGMLSNEDNFKSGRNLNYIGWMNRYGEVIKEESKTSQVIQDKIVELKQQFNQRNIEEQQKQQKGIYR